MITWVFGFICGYLWFSFMYFGIDGEYGVAQQLSWGIAWIQSVFEQVVLWIQNYTPDQNPVEVLPTDNG